VGSEREQSARLFFALWPDSDMQRALADAAEPAVRHVADSDAGVRPVSATNFHLTLVFLGSVLRSRLQAVENAASCCTGLARSVQLVLDGIEHWRKPQVLCATASETPVAATRLVDALGSALTAEGFTPDLKLPFRAHVTLARKVKRAARLPQIAPQVWTFDSFALVESKTRPEGSEYSVVASWSLD
jgi:RNA 2',3'-cyclic 3'-phosphodiesterase